MKVYLKMEVQLRNVTVALIENKQMNWSMRHLLNGICKQQQWLKQVTSLNIFRFSDDVIETFKPYLYFSLLDFVDFKYKLLDLRSESDPWSRVRY